MPTHPSCPPPPDATPKTITVEGPTLGPEKRERRIHTGTTVAQRNVGICAARACRKPIRAGQAVRASIDWEYFHAGCVTW
jgi:hypothetical protein